MTQPQSSLSEEAERYWLPSLLRCALPLKSSTLTPDTHSSVDVNNVPEHQQLVSPDQGLQQYSNHLRTSHRQVVVAVNHQKVGRLRQTFGQRLDESNWRVSV